MEGHECRLPLSVGYLPKLRIANVKVTPKIQVPATIKITPKETWTTSCHLKLNLRISNESYSK